jgi:hypothetical protein
MIRVIGSQADGFVRSTYGAAFWVIMLLPLTGTGCGDCSISLRVRGRLIDTESGAPLPETIVTGRTFTDGAETGRLVIYPPASSADGSFTLEFSSGLGPCPPAAYPTPDQIQIFVTRGACEERFMTDINGDTARFVEGMLELTNPISVPPCEPSP